VCRREPAGNLFEEPVTSESGEMQATQLGGDEEVIRIRVPEEQVTVEKHPIVREEVRILKRRVRDVVAVTDEVPHEEPVMEQIQPTALGAGLLASHPLYKDASPLIRHSTRPPRLQLLRI
jgi:Domain of unknown function (DUF2382)